MIAHDDYIRIAVITGAHGLNGRVKIYVISDIPERFTVNRSIYVRTKSGFNRCLISEYIQQKGKNALLRLQGVEDRDAALSLKGSELYITKEEADESRQDFLDDDSFYYYELVGCKVFLDNAYYGLVVDIMEAGSGEILIIEDSRRSRHMVPFVESMVDIKHMKNSRIDIIPVEGLLDF